MLTPRHTNTYSDPKPITEPFLRELLAYAYAEPFSFLRGLSAERVLRQLYADSTARARADFVVAPGERHCYSHRGSPSSLPEEAHREG